MLTQGLGEPDLMTPKSTLSHIGVGGHMRILVNGECILFYCTLGIKY